MDLFSNIQQEAIEQTAPLAVRVRPRTLDEFVGQEDVIGPGKFLRRVIDSDKLPSLIMFGPPGIGKTTLAHIIANTTGAHFEKLNAVAAGIADIRKVVDAAKKRLVTQRRRTILFIDEIHRFNKGQQDALLPYVEDGTVVLIGATTENPYFEVNSPLLSRMRVIRLQPLSREAVIKILRAAAYDKERGLGAYEIKYQPGCFEAIADLAGGDARVALNILEQAVMSVYANNQPELSIAAVTNVAGEKIQVYDKEGDNHYDVVSAFIKSMRGSDPDAALHYLARMLAAGEDVKFIARRIVICAAEDVGNADPQALVVAMAAAQAVQFLGMPEARIPLAQAVTYIASAPKSNAAYIAIDKALQDVRTKDCGMVPLHLRDTHYKGARKLGHGKDYLYPHNFSEAYVRQQYLPDKLAGTVYYQPTNHGYDREIKARLAALKGKSSAQK